MKRLLFGMMILLLMSFGAFADPKEIPDKSHCVSCGMKVDPSSRFTAEIIDKNGKVLPFCDIGDMLDYYDRLKDKNVQAYVKDFPTGKWIDAKTAFYVKHDRYQTPMSWNIGAFKDKAAVKSGTAMSMDEAIDSFSPKLKKRY